MGTLRSLLSIVIPTFNGAKYLEETIDSALSQTWPMCEVIIVDDGSTDATPELIKRYASLANVTVLASPVNAGAPSNYNRGVVLSRGTYLTFLDQDDVLLPDYCEQVIEGMESDGADMGFANLFALDGHTRKTTTLYGKPREPRYNFVFNGPDQTFPQSHDELRAMVLQAVHISPRSIYKRALFAYCGLDDTRLPISLDWLRHIAFILHGARCSFVDQPLGYYRLHADGLSQRDPLRNLVDIVRTLEIVLSQYRKLLREHEIAIVQSGLHSWRSMLFTSLSQSELATNDILKYLISQRL